MGQPGPSSVKDGLREISKMQFTSMLLKIPLIKVWHVWTIDIKYLSLHYQEIPSKHSTNLCKIIKMNSLYNAV